MDTKKKTVIDNASDIYKELKELKNKNEKLKGVNEQLIADNKNLKATNEILRKEASTYQSALGDALNFRLSDEDNNNSVQLSADINLLQDRLEKYVTTLKGPSIDLEIKAIQELYRKYQLDTQRIKDKILMKSVLQRYVLEKVLELVDGYFKIENNNKIEEIEDSYNQEKYIMNHTDQLINFFDKFYTHHSKHINNVTKAVPTKIRQQVYGVLGEFGFSEIYEKENEQYIHPFITFTAQELNQLMSGYRYIKDGNKRKVAEDMAKDLIKDIINIFKFRLMVQEPPCEIHWFKHNDKIEPKFMKGQWDDDCWDDYVVDICYFPLIGIEFGDDFSKCKVCTHARVFPRNIKDDIEEILSENKIKESPFNNNGGSPFKKNLTGAIRNGITSKNNDEIKRDSIENKGELTLELEELEAKGVNERCLGLIYPITRG
ncbi:9796_t:CDS:2 [Entrophospora sp. SA101]|nr:9796_t:CDS:2 [Entrophospora sp. SA101]